MNALELSNALHDAYATCVTAEGGFLPARIPPATLPAPLDRYVELCRELPARYHGPDAHVRPWLDAELAAWDPAHEAAIDAIQEDERHTLMTVLSTLAHAYRWDSTPPRPEEYERSRIDLPESLFTPWTLVSERLGVLRVGALYHLVIFNWRLASRPEGGEYRNGDINAANLEVSFPYLLAPIEREARALFMTIVEMEARGAQALRTIVALVSAAARESTLEATWLLDRLRDDIHQISHVFSTGIRRQTLAPENFMTLIQPTHVWGLDLGTGLLDGASGSQAPIVQALDAALGVKCESDTGKAILRGRRYMLPAHQRFLDALDRAGALVRDLVHNAGDPQLLELYNECVKGVELWRTTHQKRGALYLKEPPASAKYASVGGTVALDSDRVSAFVNAMEQRLQETSDARFANPLDAASGFDATFQWLTPDERRLLLEGRGERVYASGETVLAEGSRGQALFIVRSGAVRVETHRLRSPGDATIAFLMEGELFGEMSFLENRGSSSSVVADGACRIDVIEREHVYAMLARVPGFAGRFFQSLATVLSRRLRRTNALAERAIARQVPPRPHLKRGFGSAVFSMLPPDIRAVVDKLKAAEQPDAAAEVADALLDVLRRPDLRPDLLEAIAHETLPVFLRIDAIARLAGFPPGTPPDYAWWAALRGASSSAANPLDRWARELPTLRGFCQMPNTLAVRWGHLLEPGDTATLAGPRTAAWGPDLLTTVGEDVHLTCVEADAESIAQATARAAALGLTERIEIIPDDVLHLAWARGRTLPPQTLLIADNLLPYLPDRESVTVLEWMHANLRPGGIAMVTGLAADAPDRPFWDHVVNLALIHRDEDAVNDLFSRAGFGTEPVEIERDTGRAIVLATCVRR
jgi:CRP-like cAMP-binding protein